MGKAKYKLKRAKNPTKGMLLFEISGIVCVCVSLSVSSVIVKVISGVMAAASLVAILVWEIAFYKCPYCQRSLFFRHPLFLLNSRWGGSHWLPQYCPYCKKDILWY